MTSTFERVLDTAIAKHALTQSGKDFLEMTLNPFPNTEIRAVGYPDGRRARHTLRVVNDTFSISAPAGLVGAYDLHVFSFPQACSIKFGIGVSTSSWFLLVLIRCRSLRGRSRTQLVHSFGEPIIPVSVPGQPVSLLAALRRFAPVPRSIGAVGPLYTANLLKPMTLYSTGT